MPESFSLKGKNAIVTGGSRNLGRELALALADAGASVAILDLPPQEEAAIGVVGEIEERDVRGVFLPLDIRKVDSIREQVAALATEFGHLDVLINNAGKMDGSSTTFLEYKVDAFTDMQDIGLRGTYFMSQAVARHMVERGHGGSIIHISSRLSMQVKHKSSAYSAIKAGISHMGRAMALELGQYGIRVNSIAPGPMPAAGGLDSEFPLGTGLRFGDIPGTAIFLASEAARMITGEVILIDGGIGLRGPI
jgi:NAD(P)-dependent dehydrogenase (short-subunit alcohol dehydrogenase family)